MGSDDVRASVIGSGIVHLVLLAVLLITRPNNVIIVPGPDVVQVSLVDNAATPIVQPVTPPVEPKPEPVAVAPTEDAGVKLQPPKVKPKPKPETRTDEAPPPPAPVLPYAAVGTSGLKGAISLDSNFEFTYYLTLVRNRIAQSWAPPAGLTAGGQPVQAVMYFRIARDGGITGLRLETGSGYEFFDRSALRAVQLSDPLPPLPLGYSGSDLGVHFGFQFVAP